MIILGYIITLLFGIYCVIFSKKVYNSYFNHYLIMNAWWLITMLLSFYNTSIYTPLNVTYYIFYIGLFAFNITVFFVIPPRINQPKVYISIINIEFRRIIELIVLVFISPYVIKNFALVLSGVDLGELHADYFKSKVINNSDFRIQNFIITPLIAFLILTIFYRTNSTSNNKYSLKISFIILFMILLSNVFVNGGRTELLTFGIFYFISCLLAKSNRFKHLFIENLKLNYKYIILFIVVIYLISLNRGHINKKESGITTTLNSYTLYVGIFNYYIKNPNIAFNELTYGFSTFESLIQLLQTIFRNFFNSTILDYFKPVDFYIQRFIPIGPKAEANAHATMYFKFIRDWGYIGIVIGPVLLALICHYLYNLMLKRSLFIFFYIYTCYMLTTSTLFFQMTKLSYLLTYIYLLVFDYFIFKHFRVYNKENA